MKIRNRYWCFLAFFSLLLGACSSKADGDSSQRDSSLFSSASSTSDIPSTFGTHEISLQKTDRFLAKGGLTSYLILLPKGAGSFLQSAANELREFLDEASGASFRIVTEGNDGFPSDAKYLSLGQTNLLKSLSFSSSDPSLKTSEYRIRDEKDNLFIYGSKDEDVLNGVYGYLHSVIGFEPYAKDQCDYVSGDIPFFEIKAREIPDIPYRIGNNARTIEGSESYRRRLRYGSTNDFFMIVNGGLWHNAFSYIDPSAHSEDKKWFSSSGDLTDYKQLCYTAHGDSAEYEKMQELVAGMIVDKAKTSALNNVTFMQADVNSWCDCEACSRAKNTYGTDAAVVIHFLNDLSDHVQKKLAEEGMPDRQITISFFAYEKTEKAPTQKNPNGSYSPIDSSVLCRDNVAVFYAPIYGDYTRTFNEEENHRIAENVQAWKAISKKLYMWTYQTNFQNYLYPYNSIPTMQERYRFLAENNAAFLWDESQWDQDNPTAFHSLKNYLSAKLAWNVNENMTTLLEEYFSHYFGPAALTMRRYYDELSAHLSALSLDGKIGGGIYDEIAKPAFFPKALLDQWDADFQQAYRDIASLQEKDKGQYALYQKRICLESLFVRYALIGLYPGRFSIETLRSMKQSFIDDCSFYGVSRVSESTNLSSIFADWGL